MTDDLVKRLREKSSDQYLHNLLDDAADCIEELMKYKSLHAGCDKVSLDIEQKLVNQLAAAHKRNKELEAALSRIYAWYPISVTQPHQTIDEMREFARAALAGEKKDD